MTSQNHHKIFPDYSSNAHAQNVYFISSLFSTMPRESPLLSLVRSHSSRSIKNQSHLEIPQESPRQIAGCDICFSCTANPITSSPDPLGPTCIKPPRLHANQIEKTAFDPDTFLFGRKKELSWVKHESGKETHICFYFKM